MSLSTLKFVSVAKAPSSVVDPTARVRSKFMAALNEQKASVQAAIDGTEFKPSKKAGGDQERQRRFSMWWFRSGAVYYTNLKYGTSVLTINGGTSIECGKELKDVLKVYEVVDTAAKAGELDEVLMTTAEKRGKRFKGKAADELAAKKAAKK